MEKNDSDKELTLEETEELRIVREFVEKLEKNMVNLPPEYDRLITKHFWRLVK